MYFDTPSTAASAMTLFNILKDFKGTIDGIAIEDVHSLFGMSAKSNFQFGRQLGRLEVVCELLEAPIYRITPKVWQSDVGISFPKGTKPADKKQISFQKAVEIFPDQKAMFFGPKGGLLDGRVDALLIAYALSKELYDDTPPTPFLP
jgi:hypothetical protein